MFYREKLAIYTIASCLPASAAWLWPLCHCFKLRTDGWPEGGLRDRQVLLHMEDEQCSHKGLRGRCWEEDNCKSGLSHKCASPAQESRVLFQRNQQHRLRGLGSFSKHEEGWKWHSVQHAEENCWQLPNCQNLRDNGEAHELLRCGIQEGDRKRPVSLTREEQLQCLTKDMWESPCGMSATKLVPRYVFNGLLYGFDCYKHLMRQQLGPIYPTYATFCSFHFCWLES